MNREELLNKLLVLLPTKLSNINDCRVIGDKMILSTEDTKYTMKIFSKRVRNEADGCRTFLYQTDDGELVYKPKKKFLTDKEAIRGAMRMNIKPETIHKYVAYKCTKCYNWHIGKNSTVLTNNEKAKLKILHNL